jgi:AraC family transcriptional regulator
MANAVDIFQGAFGRIALLDMDQGLVAHAHPHCHVLVKISGADSAFLVHDRLCPLTDETIVLVNPWELHSYLRPPGDERALILALYIEPTWLAELDRAFGASAGPGFFPAAVVGTDARLRSLAGELARSLATAQANGCSLGLLDRFMAAVISRFSTWRERAAQGCGGHWQPCDFRTRKAMRYMRENLGCSFTLEDLARQVGLSRAQLFRVFQSDLRLTPRAYFNSLRLEGAVEMLARDEGRLAAISGELGFSMQGHFTRFFRGNAGVVPSEYRRVVRLEKKTNPAERDRPMAFGDGALEDGARRFSPEFL